MAMQQSTSLLNKPYLKSYYQESNYIHYFLQKISNTPLFIQYDSETLLTFKVYEVSQGVLVYLRSGEIALQCQIRGTTYTFTRNHIVQMSYGECREFFKQLGIDGSQFF